MGEAALKIQNEVEQERQKGSIVFLPSAIVPESFYRPVMERIFLTEDDIYTSQKKFRVRYDGLLKLSNAAGIEWSAMDSGRTDPGNDKLYVSFRAVGLIRKADGKLYPTAANYELDLELVKEDLEDQYRDKVKSWSNKTDKEKEEYVEYCVRRDWKQKRRHKTTLAESGAKARVIRAILGLQSQYSNKGDIVGKPFVIVRFVLDHQNPDIRQAMLSAAKDNMAAVYGGNALPSQPSFPRSSHTINPGDASGDQDNVINIPTSPAPDPSPDDIPFDETPPGDSMRIDFENATDADQVDTLKELCKRKNYDLNNYLQRANCELFQLSPAKRMEFFDYLTGL